MIRTSSLTSWCFMEARTHNGPVLRDEKEAFPSLIGGVDNSVE